MEEQLQKNELLLRETNTLIRHYDEIRKINGEDFNVYSLLGLEHAENKTHSNFLAELLNPKGSHHMGNVFLKLFLEALSHHEIDLDTASVQVEKNIGIINTKNSTGGRIDIFIEDSKGNTISIENKIYAGDQDQQLKRYYNYNTAKNTVYYLTLFGSDASAASKRDLKANEDYQLISYKDDILNWLEACKKEAVDVENIRSAIGHYIQLIKKLTNQNSSRQMSKEIRALITNNYKASRMIANEIEETEKQTVKKVFEEVKSMLSEKLENWKIEDRGILNRDGGIEIKPLFKKYNTFIRIEGYPYIWKNVGIIGYPKFHLADQKIENPVFPDLSKSTFFNKGFKTNKWWLGFKHFLWFNDQEYRAKLFDEKERQIIIEYIINEVADLAKEFESA